MASERVHVLHILVLHCKSHVLSVLDACYLLDGIRVPVRIVCCRKAHFWSSVKSTEYRLRQSSRLLGPRVDMDDKKEGG